MHDYIEEVFTLSLRRPLFLIEGNFMCEKNEFAKELETKIWKTKGSRFNKSRRYKNKNRLSSMSISILTLYVLSITIAESTNCFLPLFLNHETVTFLTIILAIGILILSLHESSRGYELKGERLYNCANELTMLYNRLRLIIVTDCSVDKLTQINDQYETIISKYNENQDPCDYSLFQAEHYKEFKLSKFESLLIKGKYYTSQYWLYFSLIVVPVAILVIYILLNLDK